jgi:nucleoside-diphosphate-sugar epimerase
MKRTLVTGAAGFTGRYVAELLAGRGHEVHGLVHGAAAFEAIPGVAQVHEADLADLTSVERIVQDVRPDHVVHLAAIAFVAHEDVEQMYRSNVVGTRQLLEALVRLPQPPQSILLASSANIYGNAREGVLDESLPPAPANDYGVSKTAMEFVARLYAERLPIIVVRPFNYTGRGQSANFLVPKIVAHVRDREPAIELGNLDVARDFSDVRAVADAYARLLDEPAAAGGTYNVCSGEAVSLQAILDMVSKLSGHRLKVKVNPAFVRANEVRSLCGTAAKFESAIGPLLKIPLEDTLRWMLED